MIGVGPLKREEQAVPGVVVVEVALDFLGWSGTIALCQWKPPRYEKGRCREGSKSRGAQGMLVVERNESWTDGPDPLGRGKGRGGGISFSPGLLVSSVGAAQAGAQ